VTEELSREQDMNTSQENTPSEHEEVEDLTLFANESFDTDDVDLFEFTGEDDSPLTRLKSILLSLDWEISDDILQELTDEIGNLQQMWQGDKVAKVYLQGLDKIGSYLRTEGAYAHPNAIKLLLTFFYNFEKIISSQAITGDTISSLLKADVRKFKILQYQINQRKGAPGTVAEGTTEIDQAEAGEQEEAPAVPLKECDDPLTCLKATILGLEWEVTDKGLDQFNSQIAEVRELLMGNKSAQILIQGLQALGGYITDERVKAHPEAFSLLHSFYDGLELLLRDDQIDEEEQQNILIDRVNRLNSLKSIIAASAEQVVEHNVADDIIDEVMTPVEEEEAPESDEELLVEDISEESDSGGELTFELPEEDTSEQEEPAVETVTRAAMETADTAYPNDVLDPSAIQPVDDKVADDFIEEELSIGTEITPALAGSEEETSEEEQLDGELEEELDLFFAGDGEDTFVLDDDQGEGEADSLEISFADDNVDAGLSEVAEESTESEDLFTAVDTEDEESTFTPALSGTDEDGGFDEDETVAALDGEPTAEIDDKLDAFFGAAEDSEVVSEETEFISEQEEELLVAPALADADDESGFDEDETIAALDGEPTAEIDDKLDAFFGADDESEAVVEETETAEELFEEEEDLLVAPALTDADDDGGFDEDETVAALDGEPTAELDDKLDAFFGTDDTPEAVVEETETAEELLAEEEDLLVAPALADADEEGGFDEDETMVTLDGEPTAEIDDKLDAFFGADDESEAVVEETETAEEFLEEEDDFLVAPALAEADEVGEVDEDETVAALEGEPTAEIDDKLDAFFGADEEPAMFDEPGEESSESLQALAVSLAAFAAKPSAEQLEESKNRVQQLQEEPEKTTERTVLLQLLQSVLTLIPEEADSLPDGTTDLTDYLRLQIESEETSSEVLVTAISRFTAWQKNMIQSLLKAQTIPESTTTPTPENLEQVTSEVRSGFDDLRSALKEEFDSLRSELKTGES